MRKRGRCEADMGNAADFQIKRKEEERQIEGRANKEKGKEEKLNRGQRSGFVTEQSIA